MSDINSLSSIQSYVQNLEEKQGWDSQSAPFGITLLTEEVAEVADALEQAMLTVGLTKRLGKLSRAVRAKEVGRFGHNESSSDEEKVSEIGKECADVIFAVVKIANYYNIDLVEAFQELQDKMNKRFPETEVE